ncbi:MAG: HAMP domain-containing sensor histidine kinase [Rickettsiales bacterium]|nr:HAMP domain-containing sensor histidine kinase [Pseudomonadota bacterium]MDA0965961.1 HAMP domain-containing sensor histidine kinase [Pseudomonadota bacterium]MDG4542567.1 HAMP domain-containing sensor histidine kinase [Rickettsiales bacterium]MDG4545071.1 HAMP domain-containing sensor histidine kinase [Rickettsiales bacterium]MDG4547194.1 HAMP domain-containing sensor histidine kinase [Rickettsiales bacterium]
MLRYFNVIAFLSFILVVVAAFFAGMYFRSFAANSVIKTPIVEGNTNLIEKLSENIICKYYPILKALDSKPVNDWQDDKYFKKYFLTNAKESLSMNAAEKISIYTENKEMFFTTHDAEVVFLSDEEPDILHSVTPGQTKGVLLTSLGMYQDNQQDVGGSYVRTVSTFSTANCTNTYKDGGETKAVKDEKELKFIVEIYDDVTKSYEKLSLFHMVVSFSIIITFILLYLALFLTSRKTEKLINKQHDEKLRLERAKTAAEAQNQQKSMFLANVSHELRTPLNAIIGFSEIIRDEVMGPVGHPQYKEYITDINSSGVHLLSLINDILDYSKADARKLDVEKVDVDLSKIAHSCLRLIEPRAKEAHVHLVENLPANHVVLSADPKRMKQVILNLLSNAVKFTPEDGKVTLTLIEDAMNGNVIINVVDTGIGIAAKDISKAMAPFGQIDSSISRRYEGTGLGLPLTKKLTELMGGTFDIKSEVGLGTTVELLFPMIKVENAEEANLNF